MDSFLQRDMTALARNQAVADLILIAEADRRWVIPAAWIAEHVSVSTRGASGAPEDVPSPSDLAAEVAVPTLSSALSAR